MVLDKPRPGDAVWLCSACGKTYHPAEIDIHDPICRDLACRSKLQPSRL